MNIETEFKLIFCKYGRWLIASGLVGMVLGVGHWAIVPKKYAATARLMVYQPDVKPLRIAEDRGAQPREHEDKDDYVATQSGILTSPLIVGRALEISGGVVSNPTAVHGSDDPIDVACDHLKVTRPDRTAKILAIEYRAKSRKEAIAFVQALVDSYSKYTLHDVYQSNYNRVVALIESSQGDMQRDLSQAEQEYIQFCRDHPGLTVARQGRSANTERVLRWCTAANETAVRVVRLRTQLEMSRKLAKDGARPWAAAYAIDELGGTSVLLQSMDIHSYQGGSNDYARTLVAEQRRVSEELGPQSSRVSELQARLQKVREHSAPSDRGELQDLTSSMEQAVIRLVAMQKEYEAQFASNLQAFNADEVAMLQEDALKSKLERARSLYNTVIDHLKQAKILGDYNITSLQVLEAPHSLITPVSPKLGLSVGFGLLLGSLSGAGVAFIKRRYR